MASREDDAFGDEVEAMLLGLEELLGFLPRLLPPGVEGVFTILSFDIL